MGNPHLFLQSHQMGGEGVGRGTRKDQRSPEELGEAEGDSTNPPPVQVEHMGEMEGMAGTQHPPTSGEAGEGL